MMEHGFFWVLTNDLNAATVGGEVCTSFSLAYSGTMSCFSPLHLHAIIPTKSTPVLPSLTLTDHKQNKQTKNVIFDKKGYCPGYIRQIKGARVQVISKAHTPCLPKMMSNIKVLFVKQYFLIYLENIIWKCLYVFNTSGYSVHS